MFTIQQNSVVLDQHVFIVPEYKAVMETYGDYGIQVFKYIYMRYDFRVPGYANLSEDEREKVCQKDFNVKEDDSPVFESDCPIIKAAVVKYKELQETPSMRLFFAAKKSMEQLTNYLDSCEIDPYLSTRDKTSEIKTLTDTQVKIASIVDSYKKLETQVKMEIAQGLARGNAYVSSREIPK